jgi:hypothetical protein
MSDIAIIQYSPSLLNYCFLLFFDREPVCQDCYFHGMTKEDSLNLETWFEFVYPSGNSSMTYSSDRPYISRKVKATYTFIQFLLHVGLGMLSIRMSIRNLPLAVTVSFCPGETVIEAYARRLFSSTISW